MNDKFKLLTEKLSILIKRETMLFILKNSEEEENTKDLLNLIVSSHISSLHNCMLGLADGDEEATKKVKEFLLELMKFISGLSIMESSVTLEKNHE